MTNDTPYPPTKLIASLTNQLPTINNLYLVLGIDPVRRTFILAGHSETPMGAELVAKERQHNDVMPYTSCVILPLNSQLGSKLDAWLKKEGFQRKQIRKIIRTLTAHLLVMIQNGKQSGELTSKHKEQQHVPHGPARGRILDDPSLLISD